MSNLQKRRGGKRAGGPTEIIELVPNTYEKPETLESNTAFPKKYIGNVTLSDSNAQMFATFGYKDPRFYISLQIQNERVLALIDSGSTRTYVGENAANLLGNFESTDVMMKAANNNIVKVNGVKPINFSVRGVDHEIETRFISSLKYGCIIGTDFLRTFKVRIDFGSGVCSLPGGGCSWQVNFPEDSQAFAYPSVDSISAIDPDGDPRGVLNVTIKGITVKALVDSGSTRTYLGPIFESLLEKQIIPVLASVLLADNSVEPVVGEVNTLLTLGKTRKSLPIRIVGAIKYDCILGIDFLKAFGLIIDFGNDTWELPGNSQVYQFSNTAESESVSGDCAGLAEISDSQRQLIDALTAKYVLKPGKELSTTNLTSHVIELTDPTPIKQRVRPTSPPMLKEMWRLVDKYVSEGVLEPCRSPWSSPPVLAKKSDGSYQLCGDFRKLNSRTKKHAHPIPNVDRLLDKFRNARYITKVDMTLAFLQVPVDPNSRDFTALAIPGRGQVRFKRMPFGLSNAPSTYQAMMDQLIQKLPPGADEHVFAYLDDLCVVTETFEEHLFWLEVVLAALAEGNLEVNLEKSQFCTSQVKYLGYVVDTRGLQVDPDKTKAIQEYPEATNLRQLRRFLGMVGWYCRFMADFSHDKVILCDLMRKNAKWEWTPEHSKVFQKIKKDLITAPVLIRPDFEKEFALHTDASDFAIGAVLTQQVDGEQHPIIFVNRLLTSAERKFTTTDKECLGRRETPKISGGVLLQSIHGSQQFGVARQVGQPFG